MARTIKNIQIAEEGTLGLYLKEIARHRTLRPEEEADIARRIKKGDKKAVETLVKANLRFVVSVARNYQNQGMPLADLINEGNLGLIRAAYRFDEKKNFKFISYAVWWIRQAILQSLANHSRIVKMPLNRVATIHKVGKARAKLEQKYRRLPNADEVAEELGIEEQEVTDMLQIGNTHTSLDAPLSDGKKGNLLDMLSDEADEESPDLHMINISLSEEITRILSTLNARERDVLRLYFGIGHDTAYTLEEIGVRTNITRERVRQIKDGALQKLRQLGRTLALKSYAG